MRTLALVVAAVMLTVFLLPTAGVPADAGLVPPRTTGAPVELKLTVVGEPNGTTTYKFTPNQILVPSLPLDLNITFHNNQTAASNVHHTFTINNNAGKPILSYDLAPQENVTFNMTVNSISSSGSNITWNGTSFTPEAGPNGGIRYYCIYHLPQMVGEIDLAGAPSPTTTSSPTGVFLRAYWIGMIGIASMIVWVGISYFIIKGSSPHFKDHREHVRKGLP